MPAQEIARHHDVLFHHENVAARPGSGLQVACQQIGALLAAPIWAWRRQVDLVASQLRSELVDDVVDARVVPAIGTKQHVQIADSLGAPQVIETVPEKLGPPPAGDYQYVARVGESLGHGAFSASARDARLRRASVVPTRPVAARWTRRASCRTLESPCAWTDPLALECRRRKIP